MTLGQKSLLPLGQKHEYSQRLADSLTVRATLSGARLPLDLGGVCANPVFRDRVLAQEVAALDETAAILAGKIKQKKDMNVGENARRIFFY